MVEKKFTGVPLDSGDATDRDMWNALGEIEAAEPSPRLRQGFYARLGAASRPTMLARVRAALGFSGNGGWLTAAACLLVGIGAGLALDDAGGGNGDRLAALEQNVSQLNRRLILDRLENSSPGKRLRGIIDAAAVAENDAEIAHALLIRATEDRVRSVRAAAIDALGARITTPSVGTRLMDLLQQADSPIVQLALVDLVLRYGSAEQVDVLHELAADGRLHPDLARHVFDTLKRDTA